MMAYLPLTDDAMTSYDELVDTVTRYYSDKSRTAQQTLADLESLSDLLETQIDALRITVQTYGNPDD
jgi:ABC-type transporter Mla subunit MlaD